MATDGNLILTDEQKNRAVRTILCAPGVIDLAQIDLPLSCVPFTRPWPPRQIKEDNDAD